MVEAQLRRVFAWLVLLHSASVTARGEEIFAKWTGSTVSVFDSETPWITDRLISVNPSVSGRSIEFDPVTRQLLSFEYGRCQITCPAPSPPVTIDPVTGAAAEVSLPELDLDLLLDLDPDIDPRSREIRYFDWSGGNYRYSLDDQTRRIDQSLDLPFVVRAVAHKPPRAGASGVETYVLGHLDNSRSAVGGGVLLARIGGLNGVPPASSGEVTIIGSVDVVTERLAFDIAADGTAYISGFSSFEPEGEENQLYRVDLDSGAVELLGYPMPPAGSRWISGIAVAQPELGVSTLDVPSLSQSGVVVFVLLLAGVAVRRSRRLSTQASN